jgi:hypothetical protein
LSELTRPHWGGGLLLLLAVAFLLAVPLWQLRDVNHPLAGQQDFDVCAVLPAPPPELGRVQPTRTEPPNTGCRYVDAGKQPQLEILVSTTRQLSQGGGADTEKMFETWMKEVRISQGNGVDLPGKWRHGGAWHDLGQRQFLLFEDGGVMVLFNSAQLDAAQLQRHAEKVQMALRPPRK